MENEILNNYQKLINNHSEQMNFLYSWKKTCLHALWDFTLYTDYP